MYLQAWEITKTKLEIVFIFTEVLKKNKTMLGIDFNFYTNLKLAKTMLRPSFIFTQDWTRGNYAWDFPTHNPGMAGT